MRQLLAGLAMAGFVLVAAPAGLAQARPLAVPDVTGSAQFASEILITDVSARRGGFRGGGFRGGRAFRGGGHVRGFRGGYHRRAWAPRRFYGPRFHRPRVYYAPRYDAPRRCRIVMTYYGPRRVCGYPRRWW